MVLDGVVRPPKQVLGHLCPPVPHNPVSEKETPFLMVMPVGLLDPWVEVVVPAFTALLPNAAWQVLRYESPLLRAVHLDQFYEEFIFRFGPWSFLALQWWEVL